MLSDADLEEIRQGLRDGLRGPILLKWCCQLLAERDELTRRLEAAQALRGAPDTPADPKPQPAAATKHTQRRNPLTGPGA